MPSSTRPVLVEPTMQAGGFSSMREERISTGSHQASETPRKKASPGSSTSTATTSMHHIPILRCRPILVPVTESSSSTLRVEPLSIGNELGESPVIGCGSSFPRSQVLVAVEPHGLSLLRRSSQQGYEGWKRVLLRQGFGTPFSSSTFPGAAETVAPSALARMHSVPPSSPSPGLGFSANITEGAGTHRGSAEKESGN